MYHATHRLMAALAFVLGLILATSAHADSPAPQRDYIHNVGDQYVFVMLSPGQGWLRDEEIRARYATSGLYKNDDSEEPIWVVDWYANAVDITSDGRHLIRWGPWPLLRDYRELALEFHENGQLLKSYRVSDLVARPSKLPRSVSHYAWQEEAELDQDKKELFLKTQNGEEYSFDVTTGEILTSTRDGPWWNEHLLLIVAVGGILVIAALMIKGLL